jgi:hypothetical protein
MAIAFVGCGRSDSNRWYVAPVSGTVTMDGMPVSNAVVAFIATGSTRGQGACGRTDKAGKYQLSATRAGRGAPLGQYRVMITTFVRPDGTALPPGSDVPPITSPAKQLLPDRYSTRERTVLTATVHDTVNTIDFALSAAIRD